MRITTELLSKIAEDTVAERTKLNSGVLAAYLHGSVVMGEPVLGGTADIDLVLVYEDIDEHREIVRLTEDVHLDIEHHPRSKYEPARDLRTAPRLGSTVFCARPLYDPKHFWDFVQASVRGMFEQQDNVIGRVEPQLQAARDTWLRFHNRPPEPGPEQVWQYLDALENIVNGIACLSGFPLAERRFLLHFPEKAEAAGQPGLYMGLLGLLGVNELTVADVRSWIPLWEEAFEAVCDLPSTPAHLHRHRKAYYYRVFNVLLDSDQPVSVIWPLLRTWTRAVLKLHPGSSQAQAWQDVFSQLKLTGDGFEDRVDGLDAFLDMVEELFENWREQERG
jgi:hypothetical protein